MREPKEEKKIKRLKTHKSNRKITKEEYIERERERVPKKANDTIKNKRTKNLATYFRLLSF